MKLPNALLVSWSFLLAAPALPAQDTLHRGSVRFLFRPEPAESQPSYQTVSFKPGWAVVRMTQPESEARIVYDLNRKGCWEVSRDPDGTEQARACAWSVNTAADTALSQGYRDGEKTILGYVCRPYFAETHAGPGGFIRAEGWVTDRIRSPYRVVPDLPFPGFALEMTVTIGMRADTFLTHYLADSIYAAVDDSLFRVPAKTTENKPPASIVLDVRQPWKIAQSFPGFLMLSNREACATILIQSLALGPHKNLTMEEAAGLVVQSSMPPGVRQDVVFQNEPAVEVMRPSAEAGCEDAQGRMRQTLSRQRSVFFTRNGVVYNVLVAAAVENFDAVLKASEPMLATLRIVE
jgi:hypothetical protein